MKETTEFLEALTGTVNSGFQAAADGKLGVEDIAFFFDDISRWQEGIKNLTFAQEAAKSTPEGVENAFAAANAQMGNVPPALRYDITNALKGFYSLYRLGVAHGKQQALASLHGYKPAK